MIESLQEWVVKDFTFHVLVKVSSEHNDNDPKQRAMELDNVVL